MTRLATLMDRLGALTILEALDLVRQLEAKWGVDASPRTTGLVIADPMPWRDPFEGARFELTLTSAGPVPLAVIKAIRQFNEIGVMEVKALVDKLPAVIASGLSKDELDRAERILRDTGAEYTIKPPLSEFPESPWR